jgi:aminoglycoside N3'-acetyltransferase
MPYLVHADISNVSLEILRNKSLGTSPQDRVINSLIKNLQTNEIWFPAFNYDFATTKVFNPNKDEIQVGSINEQVTKMSNSRRTFTPIFSFAGLGELLEPIEKKLYKPFSHDSEMSTLLQEDSDVIFLGAPISSFTFIHFIEEAKNIGYRYVKRINGHIKLKHELYETALEWKVRPAKQTLKYDWNKITHELISTGILQSYPTFGKHSYIMKLSNCYEVIGKKIEEDPCYLLADDTRNWVEPKMRKLQRSFQLSDFEKGVN